MASGVRRQRGPSGVPGTATAGSGPTPPVDPQDILTITDDGSGNVQITLAGSPSNPAPAFGNIFVQGSSVGGYNTTHSVASATGNTIITETPFSGNASGGSYIVVLQTSSNYDSSQSVDTSLWKSNIDIVVIGAGGAGSGTVGGGAGANSTKHLVSPFPPTLDVVITAAPALNSVNVSGTPIASAASGADGSAGGAGGLASAGVGDTKFSGGNGGVNVGGGGGWGGGSDGDNGSDGDGGITSSPGGNIEGGQYLNAVDGGPVGTDGAEGGGGGAGGVGTPGAGSPGFVSATTYVQMFDVVSITDNLDGTAAVIVRVPGQVPDVASFVFLTVPSGTYEVASQDSSTQFTISYDFTPGDSTGGFWATSTGDA